MLPIIVAATLTLFATCAASSLYTIDPSWPVSLSSLNVTTVTAVAVFNHEVLVAQRGGAVPYFLVFDDNKGDLIRSWGPAGIKSPHGMFWSPNEPASLFIVDIVNATVKEFNASSDGKVLLGVSGTPGVHGAGTNPMQFSSPADAALTSHGVLLVSDGDGGSNNRVSAISRVGKTYGTMLWTVGSAGAGPSDFSSPHSIAYLEGVDMAIVADRGNNRIKFLAASTGDMLGEWDSVECFNAQPAATGTAWGVRVDSARGRLFVADGAHGTIYVLSVSGGTGWSVNSVPSCDGALLDTLSAPSIDSKPHEMAVDEMTGDLYVRRRDKGGHCNSATHVNVINSFALHTSNRIVFRPSPPPLPLLLSSSQVACVGTVGKVNTTTIVRYLPNLGL